MKIATIGLDVAKNVFQVHGADDNVNNVHRAPPCELRRYERDIPKVNGVESDDIFDLSGHEMTIFGDGCGAGCWARGYVYSGGELVAEYGDGTTYFMSGDHLGSTRLMTEVNQSIFDSMDYLPFGEQIAGDGGTTKKFTGYPRDTETNLDYALFRHYSSRQGSFMQADPYMPSGNPANPQSWNRYAYVGNNPLSFVDPTGLRMNCRNANTPSCRIANGGGGSFLPGCVLDGVATDCSFVEALFDSGNLGVCAAPDFGSGQVCGTLSDPGISGSAYVDLPYFRRGAAAQTNCLSTIQLGDNAPGPQCLVTVGAMFKAMLEIEIDLFNSIFPYGIPEAGDDGRAGGPISGAVIRGVQSTTPITNPAFVPCFYAASAAVAVTALGGLEFGATVRAFGLKNAIGLDSSSFAPLQDFFSGAGSPFPGPLSPTGLLGNAVAACVGSVAN